MPPEICPQCGALVPPKAKACPECGSDEKTGWSDRATSQRLGLPDDEFDYDEFVKEEFGSEKPPAVRPKGIHWFWWALALALVVWALLALSGLGRLFR
jgi:hypothetical protein